MKTEFFGAAHPAGRPAPRGPLLALVVVVAAALVLRVHYASTDTFPSVDGVFYLIQSRDFLLRGALSYSTFPPGWPVLAALPLSFLDVSDPLQVFRAAQAMNVAFGTLSVLLTWLLLRRSLGPWPAVAGAAVLAFLPDAVIASKGDLSEPSFTCLLLVATLLLGRDGFLAGLALGCAYLVRPEALLVAAGWSAFAFWRERRFPVGMVLGTLLAVTPYVLFLHHYTGEWTLTAKSGFWTAAAAEHPGTQRMALVGRNLADFLPRLPGLVGWPLTVLALVGVVRRPDRHHLLLLGLLPLPLFGFAMADRYWLPYLPVVLLAAGAGAADRIGPLVRATRRSSKAVAAAIVVVCLLGVAVEAPDDSFWISRNPNSYISLRDAGEWLQPRVGPETRVAAYKPFAPFWAGCDFVKYPAHVGTTEMLDRLEAAGVEYLVVNVHVARLLVPTLQPLLRVPLDPEYADRVRPVVAFDYNPDDHSSVVLRLVPRTEP